MISVADKEAGALCDWRVFPLQYGVGAGDQAICTTEAVFIEESSPAVSIPYLGNTYSSPIWVGETNVGLRVFDETKCRY